MIPCSDIDAPPSYEESITNRRVPCTSCPPYIQDASNGGQRVCPVYEESSNNESFARCWTVSGSTRQCVEADPKLSYTEPSSRLSTTFSITMNTGCASRPPCAVCRFRSVLGYDDETTEACSQCSPVANESPPPPPSTTSAITSVTNGNTHLNTGNNNVDVTDNSVRRVSGRSWLSQARCFLRSAGRRGSQTHPPQGEQRDGPTERPQQEYPGPSLYRSSRLMEVFGYAPDAADSLGIDSSSQTPQHRDGSSSSQQPPQHRDDSIQSDWTLTEGISGEGREENGENGNSADENQENGVSAELDNHGHNSLNNEEDGSSVDEDEEDGSSAHDDSEEDGSSADDFNEEDDSSADGTEEDGSSADDNEEEGILAADGRGRGEGRTGSTEEDTRHRRLGHGDDEGNDVQTSYDAGDDAGDDRDGRFPREECRKRCCQEVDQMDLWLGCVLPCDLGCPCRGVLNCQCIDQRRVTYDQQEVKSSLARKVKQWFQI